MNASSLNKCLIGYTGFVGSTLLAQMPFDSFYNSANIHEIDYKIFDLVVCSAAPAQKWIANKFPREDKDNIDSLINHLKKIKCKKFILISTVDVFPLPVKVNEDSKIDELELTAYGTNRRLLEKFVVEKFDDHLIVRLPGLVGKGLKKNIIYDFLNNNNLNLIDSRAIYQFYPMVNLSGDINIAIQKNLSLIHLTSAPLSVREIAFKSFNINFENILDGPVARYDMQTRFGSYFGSHVNYQYDKKASFEAILNYIKQDISS